MCSSKKPKVFRDGKKSPFNSVNRITDLKNKIDDLENKLKEQGKLTQQNEKANVELIQELLNKVEEQKDLIKQKEEVMCAVAKLH